MVQSYNSLNYFSAKILCTVQKDQHSQNNFVLLKRKMVKYYEVEVAILLLYYKHTLKQLNSRVGH